MKEQKIEKRFIFSFNILSFSLQIHGPMTGSSCSSGWWRWWSTTASSLAMTCWWCSWWLWRCSSNRRHISSMVNDRRWSSWSRFNFNWCRCSRYSSFQRTCSTNRTPNCWYIHMSWWWKRRRRIPTPTQTAPFLLVNSLTRIVSSWSSSKWSSWHCFLMSPMRTMDWLNF